MIALVARSGPILEGEQLSTRALLLYDIWERARAGMWQGGALWDTSRRARELQEEREGASYEGLEAEQLLRGREARIAVLELWFRRAPPRPHGSPRRKKSPPPGRTGG